MVMRTLLISRSRYTRSEYVSDVVVHLLGLFAVVAGVPALILAATLSSESSAPVAGTVVYSTCFAAMIAASAAYNIFPQSNWEWLLKRLDHAAIYLKIAGTVTAFALIAGKGLVLSGVLWAVAAVGIGIKLYCPFSFKRIGLALYLGMGWAVAIWGWGMFGALPPETTLLVFVAGVLYTVGVLFYLWERLPYHFTIWHCFVLIASVAIYGATLVAVIA